MRAAVRLAARRGWAETTVDDIAAAAGVSPRTFFRYFPTKVDALFVDEPERMAILERSLRDRGPDETVLAAVRRGVLQWLTEFMDDPDLYIARARLAFEHPDILGSALVRFAYLESVVAAAAADELGADARELKPRLIGAATTAAIRSTSQTWVARDGQGDPREIVNESFDLLERGLGHR
jgi:TetR/AcrR family transcriptional regulator, regulator of mycofactocin system